MSRFAKFFAALLGLALVAFITSSASRPAAQPPPSSVTFDRYHGYAETRAILDRLAAAYPELARVCSIGKDYKGYDLWAIAITNRKTGPAADKPAFYADGNIDADEPSATEVITLCR